MTLLPDEARLLFLATRPGAASQEIYIAALAASRPNWVLVGQLAEREKLMPVLWAQVKQHAGFIPESVREAFRRQALVTEFRMASLEATLQRLLQEFDGIGIPVMLLKGAALAKTVYGSFTNRPMGDLDILVRPGDAERAWRHVRDLGWTLEYEGGDEFYGLFHHLPALVDPSPLKAVLEIHRQIMPFGGPFVLDERELWDAARPVEVGPIRAWVPADHHQLLHLCTHFAWSHMFSGIGRTVRDVATLLTEREVDWPAFVALATRTRARTCAYWTLAITRSLTGTVVPADVLESLRPRGTVLPRRVLERAYVSMGLFAACPSMRAANALWAAGIQPTASGHGRPRPWHTNDRFGETFHTSVHAGVMERLRGQARSGARWWRFARTLVSPSRAL